MAAPSVISCFDRTPATSGSDAPRAEGPLLLVDDDEPTLDAVADLLEVNGFVVATAPNRDAALSLLRGGLRPSVILLDLQMRGLSVDRFLAALKTDRALAAIPIIVMTAAHPSAIPAGYVRLLKPFEPEQLLIFVSRYARESAEEPR
jgi:CheY-like chemotaxis protein